MDRKENSGPGEDEKDELDASYGVWDEMEKYKEYKGGSRSGGLERRGGMTGGLKKGLAGCRRGDCRTEKGMP